LIDKYALCTAFQKAVVRRGAHRHWHAQLDCQRKACQWQSKLSAGACQRHSAGAWGRGLRAPPGRARGLRAPASDSVRVSPPSEAESASRELQARELAASTRGLRVPQWRIPSITPARATVPQTRTHIRPSSLPFFLKAASLITLCREGPFWPEGRHRAREKFKGR
jgi:hypothetical protein